jgi:CheY-like chemotaxis protein
MEPSARPVEILLVEDHPGDVKLLQECLTDEPLPHQLSVVGDGEAAITFLARHAPYMEAPIPDLIILDVHLVTKNGWEVLEWIRATPAVATLPVVMLTGSLSPFDEQERARLQPTRCLVKPRTLEQYQEIVNAFREVIQSKPPAACLSPRSLLPAATLP